MNDTELFEHARADMSAIALARPAEQVLRRGNHLRRARRVPLAAALAVATAGGLTLWSAGPSAGPAIAGYTSSPQSTDSMTAERIVSDCRQQVGTLPLRLLDRRGTFAVAVFADGTKAATCDRFAGARNLWREGGGGGPGVIGHRAEVSDGRPIAVEGGGGGFAANVTFARHFGSLWGWSGPRVATVKVDIGGSVITAASGSGTWSAWWPDAGDPANAIVVALDAQGHELARIRPFR